MGWVKVYDTRTSNQTGASCSILAHPAPRPRKIRGIRPDPFRPYLFASYSDFPGDVVKIWDLRKVANPTSKSVVPPSFVIVPTSANAAVSPHSGNFSSQFASSMGGDAEAVVDAAWSTARAGVMAVATSQRPCVLLQHFNYLRDEPNAYILSRRARPSASKWFGLANGNEQCVGS